MRGPREAPQDDGASLPSKFHDGTRVREILCEPRVLVLAAVYFCIYIGRLEVTFWVPTSLRGVVVSGLSTIGWIEGLISLFTMLGNLAIA